MLPSWMLPKDLAPGDQKSLERDWGDIQLHRITDPDSPEFERAYEALWNEFGEKDELESREVLQRRLRWDTQVPQKDHHLLYALYLVTSGKEVVAVRDCTVALPANCSQPQATVHLSHVLVTPAWRRTGVAGWMRALPLQAARQCLRTARAAEDTPITLLGEMEPLDLQNPAVMTRLKAYEKAGFKKLNPQQIPYLQPDFRSPEEIDATELRPLPMCLVIRRIGRETEDTMPADEVLYAVKSLYAIFAAEFRPQDMTPLYRNLERFPRGSAPIHLLPPSS